MTKLLMTFAVGVCLSTRALIACDFCNCLSGINPYYNGKNRFAINFLLQRSFLPPTLSASTNTLQAKRIALPTMMHGGHGSSPFPTTETRQTIEFTAQHHLSTHLMLTALLPFSTLKIEQSRTVSVSGIGDAVFLGHYIFELPFFERTLLICGGGLKVPTALSNLTDDSGNRLDTRFQSGTGSWDFILNPMMFISQNGFTCALDIFAKFNTSGAMGDRLGHSLSATATLSHDVFRNNQTQTALVGILGTRLEAKGQDWISDKLDVDSAFMSFYAQFGGQVVLSFFKLDFLVLVPVHQSRSTLAMNEQTRFLTGTRIEF